ncbi:MAG TPA: glycosyltransferase, partial [Candidatus Paceibacterota bacterium]
KRTQELLEAFLKTDSQRLKLVIIGSISEDQKDVIENLIGRDSRISYLGWKSADELMEYLAACDLYVQPAEQSVTMQNALCCGSVVAVYPYKSHNFLLNDVAFYVESVADMINLFNSVADNLEILESKRKLSSKLAVDKLDYRKIAKRLYK